MTNLYLLSDGTRKNYLFNAGNFLFFLMLATAAGWSQNPCPGTGYCETNLYSYGCAASPIDVAIFGTINNSNSNCNAVPPTSSYCTGLNTILNAGSTYTITLGTIAPWSAHYGVWIDFNEDGTFNATNEFLLSTIHSSANLTNTVTIPAASPQGLRRMRIRSDNASTALFTGSQACTTINYGETEDYGVYICTTTTNPATPGAISGQSGPCANTTFTYSVTPVATATTYSWTVPSGAVLNSGQGTNTVSITWGVTGGTLSVTAGNCHGSSAASNLLVALVAASPGAAGNISGAAAACAGSTTTYYIAPVTDAYNYTWSAPPGSSIVSGQGTTTITVTFGSTSGGITVTPSNGCGSGTGGFMNVSVTPIPTFTGLSPNYCLNDPPSTLSGSPSGGTFSGPGISGSTFTPAAAGTGTHPINYGLCSANYSVSQSGTFSPIAGGGTAVSLGDDQVSGVLPIGFSFKFYCTAYTNFYICSNGFITFNSGSLVNYPGEVLPNNTGNPSNLIAFCWNDLNPGMGGTVNYFTSGTSPNKKLVVNFIDVPYFGGGGTITTQVVLYETSNLIEIHTTTVPGNGNMQTMGIENNGGTVASAVAGRNGVDWSANNDYVKFPPLECTATQTVTVDSCTPIGIATMNANGNITIIPNPTTGKVSVAVGSGSEYSLEIYNVMGEQIQKLVPIDIGSNKQLANNIPTVIDISSQPAGIYFLKAYSANGMTIHKIIKQ